MGAAGVWWSPQSSKLMRPDAVGLGGFDSHTLPPHRFSDARFVVARRLHVIRRLAVIGILGFAVFAGRASPTHAQSVDSARAGVRRVPRPAVPDSEKPPVSPRRAFLYSLLLPGYGQSVLDRPIAGTMFFGAEVTWIALATKSAFDLRYARAHQADSIIVTYATDSLGGVKLDSLGRAVGTTYAPNRYATARVNARRKHLEDYYALLIATHLLAGAEAFVAAQLWDLPDHVSIRALPVKALPFGAVISATVRW